MRLRATGRRLALACLPLVLAAAVAAGDRLPPAAERPVDFVKDVQPILAAACYSCHGPAKQKGDLRLDRKASVMGSPVEVILDRE